MKVPPVSHPILRTSPRDARSRRRSDRRVAATGRPFPESPSPKVYGEGAAEAGKAKFDALLNQPLSADAAGHRRHRPAASARRTASGSASPTRSPTSTDCSRRSRRRRPDGARPVRRRGSASASRSSTASTRRASRSPTRSCTRRARRSSWRSRPADRTRRTAGSKRSPTRGTRCGACPRRRMWEKPQGKNEPVRMEKRFRIVPRGVALVIGCSTFPTWNGYPGHFRRASPPATRSSSSRIRMRSCRSRSPCGSRAKCWPKAGFDPNVVTLVAHDAGDNIGADARAAPRGQASSISPAARRTAAGSRSTRGRRRSTPKRPASTRSSSTRPPTSRALARNLAFSLVALHGPDVHGAAEHLRAEGRHRHRGRAPDVRPGRRRARGGRATSCSPIRRARSRCSAPCRTKACCGGSRRRARSATIVLDTRTDRASRSSPRRPIRTPLIVKLDDGRSRDVPERMVRPDRVRHRDRRHRREPRDRARRRRGPRRADDVGLLDAATTSSTRAIDVAEDAGVALSINLTGGVFVNQSAAFSDFHGTGANPAANAALTDAAYVANRFRVVQHRGMHVSEVSHELRTDPLREPRTASRASRSTAPIGSTASRRRCTASCATRSRGSRPTAIARVLLLTGAGRGFCAGQDLSDRAVAPGGAPVDLGASIEDNYRPLVLGLRNLPLPVVCAVNGVAAGAGANIALACDIVIAAQIGELHPGVLPDRPHSRIPAARTSCRASSAPRARWASRCSATSCPPSRRRQWGLIWKCVDDAESRADRRCVARATRAGADARAWRRSSARCTRRPTTRSSSSSTSSATCSASSGLQRRLSRRRRRIPREAPAALHRALNDDGRRIAARRDRRRHRRRRDGLRHRAGRRAGRPSRAALRHADGRRRRRRAATIGETLRRPGRQGQARRGGRGRRAARASSPSMRSAIASARSSSSKRSSRISTEKRSLLRELEKVVAPTTILASNTSSLSITALAAGLKHPGRVVGMHFFNPAPLMPLVEVVSGLATDRGRRPTRSSRRPRRGARSRCARRRRRDSSSTAARGRSMARRCACWPNALPMPRRSTRCCARRGGFRMGRVRADGPHRQRRQLRRDAKRLGGVLSRSALRAVGAAGGARRRRISRTQDRPRLLRLRGRTRRRRASRRVDARSRPRSVSPCTAIPASLAPLVDRFAAAGIDVAARDAIAAFPDGAFGGRRARCSRCPTGARRPRAAAQRRRETSCSSISRSTTRPASASRSRRRTRCATAAFAAAAGLLQAAGIAVSRLDDVAGLVVLRTVAVLGERSGRCGDAGRRVAGRHRRRDAEGRQLSARAAALGRRRSAWAGFATSLHNLAAHYGEDRYRLSPLIARRYAVGQPLSATGDAGGIAMTQRSHRGGYRPPTPRRRRAGAGRARRAEHVRQRPRVAGARHADRARRARAAPR